MPKLHGVDRSPTLLKNMQSVANCLNWAVLPHIALAARATNYKKDHER